MIALSPDKRRRLIAAAKLLESDRPGDRQAAAEAMSRLTLGLVVTVAEILEHGLTTVALSGVPPRPVTLSNRQRWAMDVMAKPTLFDREELGFARRMFAQRRAPSVPQLSWLKRLAERAGGGR